MPHQKLNICQFCTQLDLCECARMWPLATQKAHNNDLLKPNVIWPRVSLADAAASATSAALAAAASLTFGHTKVLVSSQVHGNACPYFPPADNTNCTMIITIVYVIVEKLFVLLGKLKSG